MHIQPPFVPLCLKNAEVDQNMYHPGQGYKDLSANFMVEDGLYEFELLRNEIHAPSFTEIIISLSLPF